MEGALKLIIRQEHCDPPIEIDVSSRVRAATFSANGEYFFSSDVGRVRGWRVKDGKQVARMEATAVVCLAVSKDGRWVAAGTLVGALFVWDAKTRKQVFKYKEDEDINGVDFSPDSSCLVSASANKTATIWDIPTRKRVRTLDHISPLRAAKFSPLGDRIATATKASIRVWDSKNGRLLVDIGVGVTPWYNTGLLWSNNRLIAISYGEIKEIDASTGLVVSQWPLAESDENSCIALPKHWRFIAYSAKRSVTFWHTSSHTKLGYIQHPQDVHSITHSPDDDFIAIGGERGNLIVRRFSHIVVSVLCLWIVVYMNNFVVPIIQSLCLVYAPGTRHSDKRNCARCLEAQSTRKCRRIVD